MVELNENSNQFRASESMQILEIVCMQYFIRWNRQSDFGALFIWHIDIVWQQSLSPQFTPRPSELV